MQATKFKYLPHTADIEFVAYGSDFKEGVENAALALLSIMLDVKRIAHFKGRSKSIRISERADTKENLVWYTLQDILSKIDEKDLCAFKFKAKLLGYKGGDLGLKGELSYMKSAKDCFLTEVKAVTPYGLKIKESKGRCEIFVVVDV